MAPSIVFFFRYRRRNMLLYILIKDLDVVIPVEIGSPFFFLLHNNLRDPIPALPFIKIHCFIFTSLCCDKRAHKRVDPLTSLMNNLLHKSRFRPGEMRSSFVFHEILFFFLNGVFKSWCTFMGFDFVFLRATFIGIPCDFIGNICGINWSIQVLYTKFLWPV